MKTHMKFKFFIDLPQIRPFAICIWCGEGKPMVNEYLKDFVDELKFLLANGVLINGHVMKIKIKFFVCDTPARSYIKGLFSF